MMKVLCYLWHVIRLPVLAILLVLEHPLRLVLSSLAVLGIFMTLVFEYVLRVPRFPFWTMLAISASFAVALVPLYGLIWLFSADPTAPSKP
jgi:hypothetical protein